jgi:hypothetical protein
MNGELGRRNGTAATAEPVSWVATAMTVAQPFELCPRLHHLRQQPRGHLEPLEHIERPGPRTRVEALRRGRVGELRRERTAEPVVHQIRDQEQRLGGLECRVGLRGHGPQLEDRVDRHQLDARALVEIPRGHLRKHAFHRAGTTVVAVVDRILQEAAVPVQQAEVDGPRIGGN